MASQLQVFMDETNYLDWLALGAEIAFMAGCQAMLIDEHKNIVTFFSQ